MMSPKPSKQPDQYIKGYVEFYKLKFKVTPDVLIPRPETELLVDEVITHARGRLVNLTILDMGTGSGCIAVSIAKNLSLHPRGAKLNIIATDISPKALKVAKQNAKLHGVLDKIKFVKSNLLSAFSQYDVRSHNILVTPDIIVANLPYIPSARIPTLDSSVKDFEPILALDGGEDGFELYRKLFTQIKEKNWNPKLIVCEIDHTHESIAKHEAKKYFPGYEIEVKKDLAKNIRILKITAEETQPQ